MSFEASLKVHFPCVLPCTPVPVIAPRWTDWTFKETGSIYYRETRDQTTLDQVAEMIADVNPGLGDYQPTLAVIVTWFEARHFNYLVSVAV